MRKIILFGLFFLIIVSCSWTNKINDRQTIFKVSKSIVTVYSEKDREPNVMDVLLAAMEGKPIPKVVTEKWLGSGSVLNKESGYIITNKHVAPKEEGVRIHVRISGLLVDGEVLYNHKYYDLAVVKVDPFFLCVTENIKFGKTPMLGDEIGILGHPYGLYSTFTFGYVSAYRMFEDGWYIQTDAHMNPGNSGGLAFNVYGEFVGIPSAGIPGAGIGFILSGQLIRTNVFEFLPETAYLRKPFKR